MKALQIMYQAGVGLKTVVLYRKVQKKCPIGLSSGRNHTYVFMLGQVNHLKYLSTILKNS